MTGKIALDALAAEFLPHEEVSPPVKVAAARGPDYAAKMRRLGSWAGVLASPPPHDQLSERRQGLIGALVKRHFTTDEIWTAISESSWLPDLIRRKGERHARNLIAMEIEKAQALIVPFPADDVPPAPKAAASQAPSSTRKLTAAPIDFWLNSDEEDDLDVVIGDGGEGAVLTIDGQGFIAGPTGVGKTNLLLRLGRSLANGSTFLNLPIPKPRRVMHLALEGGKRGLRRRLDKIWKDASLESRSRYVFGRAQVNLLDDTAALDDLIREHQPEVLIIDPLRNAHILDENDSQQMAELTAACDALRSRHGLALIFAHHDRKKPMIGRESGADRVRGSTALTGWLTFCLSIAADPKEPGVLLTEWVKTRDAEEPLPLLRIEVLRETLDFHAESRTDQVDIPETLKTIVFHARELRRPDLIASAMAQAHKGKRKVEDAIRALVEDGTFVTFKVPRDKADWLRLAEDSADDEGLYEG